MDIFSSKNNESKSNFFWKIQKNTQSTISTLINQTQFINDFNNAFVENDIESCKTIISKTAKIKENIKQDFFEILLDLKNYDLIKYFTNINPQYLANRNFLKIAIEKNDTNLFYFDIDITNNNIAWNLLQEAFEVKNINLINYILRQNPNIIFDEIQDYSLKSQNYELIVTIIENCNISNFSKDYLIYAIDNENIWLVNKILKNKTFINNYDIINYAILNEKCCILKELLELWFNITDIDLVNWNTTLMNFILSQYFDNPAKLNIFESDDFQKTFYYIIDTLSTNKIIKIKNKQWETALKYAVEKNSLYLIDLLIKRWANPWIKNNENVDAIDTAVNITEDKLRRSILSIITNWRVKFLNEIEENKRH